MIKGVLFDWGGVLHDDNGPMAGAASCLQQLSSQNIPWRIISNTTSKPPQYLLDKLDDMGVQADATQILTPITASQLWLRQQARRNPVEPIALFVADSARSSFQALSLLAPQAEKGARTVIIGDLAEGWNYQQINRALRLLTQQPTPHFIALGATRYWQAADGLRIDVGPIAAALEYASGIKPITLGKPSPDFFALALAQLGVSKEHVLIVGDDIESDIHGAQQCGLQTALVRTGKFQATDLQKPPAPDVVLDSVADLSDWLDAAH